MKRRREKRKREIFGAVDCPGVPEVSPCQKGWLCQHLPEGLWYSGRARPGLAAAVAMVTEERAETAQKCHCLPGRYWGKRAIRSVSLPAARLLTQLLCCSPSRLGWLGRGGYLVQAAVQKLPAFEGGGMFVLLSLTWLS